MNSQKTKTEKRPDMKIDQSSIQESIAAYCKILRLPQVTDSFEEEALKARKTKMRDQE